MAAPPSFAGRIYGPCIQSRPVKKEIAAVATFILDEMWQHLAQGFRRSEGWEFQPRNRPLTVSFGETVGSPGRRRFRMRPPQLPFYPALMASYRKRAKRLL